MYYFRGKSPKTEFFSGPHFPAFELNTEIYSVLVEIYYVSSPKNMKIRTRKNSAIGHISCSVALTLLTKLVPKTLSSEVF